MSRVTYADRYYGVSGVASVQNVSTARVTNYDYAVSKASYITLDRSDVTKTPAPSEGMPFRRPSGYRARKQVNPAFTLSHSAEYQDSAWRYEDSLDFWGYFDTDTTIPLPADPSPAVRSKAVSQMLKKLSDRKMDLALTLLEARESVDMVHDAVTRLAKACAAAKRKDPLAVARALGVPMKKMKDLSSPASIWLAYHFGWAPLVSDIGTACSLIANGIEKPLFIRAAGRAFRDTEVTKSGTLTRSWNGTLRAPYRFQVKSRTEYKVSCYYQLESSSLRQASQLGLVNPAEVIWGAAPMSFVLDWVIPISDVLSSLSATVGLQFVVGCETVYRSSSGKPVLSKPSWQPDLGLVVKHQDHVGFGYEGENMLMERNVLNKSPSVTSLWIENPFSPWRFTTASALLRSVKK